VSQEIIVHSLASFDGTVNENVLDGACTMHEAMKGACKLLAGEPQRCSANLTSSPLWIWWGLRRWG